MSGQDAQCGKVFFTTVIVEPIFKDTTPEVYKDFLLVLQNYPQNKDKALVRTRITTDT